MITIETDMLITVLVGIFSTVISAVVTWFFSKRHYSKIAASITEMDLELQRVKNESKSEVLVFIFLLVLVIGMLAVFFGAHPFYIKSRVIRTC